MAITTTTSSPTAIVSAKPFITSTGRAMLCFDDEHGCSRLTLHGVPFIAAQITADAFNDALALDQAGFTYETDIDLENDHGAQEDLPATFRYSADYQPAEPDVGISRGYWEAYATLHTVKIGSLTLVRAQVVKMFGEYAVFAVEGTISERIASELDAGDLKAA